MDLGVWVLNRKKPAKAAVYEEQEQPVVDEEGNPVVDADTGAPVTQMVQVEIEAAEPGGKQISGPKGCKRCEAHGLGWWAGGGTVPFMGALRNAMMTEKIFNPIGPPLTKKHDTGHFMPIELPIATPCMFRDARHRYRKECGDLRNAGAPTMTLDDLLIYDPHGAQLKVVGTGPDRFQSVSTTPAVLPRQSATIHGHNRDMECTTVEPGPDCYLGPGGYWLKRPTDAPGY